MRRAHAHKAKSTAGGVLARESAERAHVGAEGAGAVLRESVQAPGRQKMRNELPMGARHVGHFPPSRDKLDVWHAPQMLCPHG